MKKKLFSERLKNMALQWKAENLAVLDAEIYIDEKLLEERRRAREQWENMPLEELVVRYGWESPDVLKRITQQRKEWLMKMGFLWVTNVGRKDETK